MRFLSLIPAALVATCLSAPAQAYSYLICDTSFGDEVLNQPSNSLTARSSANSFPAGAWRDGIIDAISRYNRNSSKFTYKHAVDSGGVGLDNGQSEIWGSTDQGILDGAPAIAISQYECYYFFGVVANMLEGDIVFDYTDNSDNAFEWTPTNKKSGLGSYAGTKRLMQGTAVHELGHAAGLQHEDDEYNVMGSDFTHLHTNGPDTVAYIGEDTSRGMVFLYGTDSGATKDAGLAHWRYSGSDGEYSEHARTRIFNNSGVELSKSTINGEPRYNVVRGNQVRLELTYENNGRTTLTDVLVRYYISTNDTISTSDRHIGSRTIGSLGANDVLTDTRTLTIPSNLDPNKNYWIGAVINPTKTFTESYRINNATYIGIRTN
jgi:hypothetical protein